MVSNASDFRPLVSGAADFHPLASGATEFHPLAPGVTTEFHTLNSGATDLRPLASVGEELLSFVEAEFSSNEKQEKSLGLLTVRFVGLLQVGFPWF